MQESNEGKKGDVRPNFEAAFERLQFTVKKLESGDLSLEESLQQFEEGVRLTRICQDYLSAAEQRVEILMKNSGTLSGQEDGQPDLQPFRK